MVSAPRSLSLTLVFWWGVYLVIQSAERLFLVATTISREPPTAATLGTTLRAGFRADLMGAAGGIVIAVVLGLVIGASLAIAKRWRKGQAVPGSPWKVGVTVGAVVVALLMLAVATADMGYYHYSQRRADLVLLESVIDVFSPPTRAHLDSSLVDRQTAAQADGVRWVGYAAAFAGAMAAAIVAWWLAFTRAVGPLLRRCIAAAPRTSVAVLVLALIATGTSFDREARFHIYRLPIASSTYYTLAQNPFWSLWDSLEQVIGARVAGTEAALLRTVPEETAVRVTRETVAPGAMFPSLRYPLVHTAVGDSGVRLARPDQRDGRRPSILVIIVEGLDRRFLGRTVRGIRVTPFLDRLRGESVYFEHFFSNGASTFHGLFASFCSALPRFSRLSPTRTHYGSDFLCLPEALKRGGYRSEMVIGQSRERGQSHLGLFMARNGLDALHDEGTFAPRAPRNRLGVLDGALLDLVRSRVETLHAADRPFFLATLTTSTHHPFKVPQDHPEVRALGEQSDRYVTALRYFDVELERFFSGLRRDGLLRNTVVLILGDHGRHGRVGRTDAEAMVGNFLAPLFVWMDESLVDPTIFRPRTVSAVASQVDLPPTILSMTALMPGLTPFVGRDLSCAFVRECLADNIAYLSNVSENLLGLVDRDGIWMYPVGGRTGHEMDLGAIEASRERAVIDPQVAPRQQRLLSLYVTGNLLLVRNRLWSTQEFWDPGHGVTAPSRSTP